MWREGRRRKRRKRQRLRVWRRREIRNGREGGLVRDDRQNNSGKKGDRGRKKKTLGKSPIKILRPGLHPVFVLV